MPTTQEEILKLVERMPAFPRAVTRVLELTSQADCSTKELVKEIEHDPVMTAKILKLVNSAFYGLSRPIKSINHGVVYVGINTIKNLALAIAAIGMLPRQNKINFDINQFLLHSLGVAEIAKRLANELHVVSKRTPEFFIAGLLHDFGKVVLAQFRPEQFRQALEIVGDGSRPLYQAEQEILGFDHAEIGGMLADSWKLPANLADCIRNHHNPELELEDELMRDVVFTANQIVHAIPFGNSGNRFTSDLPENVVKRFGRELPELMEHLGDLSEELNKARGFIQH